MLKNKYVWLSLLWVSQIAFASDVGIGAVAGNITEPIEVVSGFVSIGCLMVGAACLFATVVKYFEHRRSPTRVTISTVIWLFIIGLLLLILPFAYMITENGIPFSELWGGRE